MKQLGLYLLLFFALFGLGNLNAQGNAADDAKSRAVEYYYMHANALLLQERIDEAFDMLEHCLAIDPESSAVMHDLALFHQLLGNDSIAKSMLERIVAKEPGNVNYSEALINYYASNDDRQSAIALYERMLGESEVKDEIYMALYSLYSEENEHDKAADVLDKLEVITGKNEIISLHRVKTYVFMQDSTRALAAARKMLVDFPGGSSGSLLGDIYTQFGDYANAEKAYLAALERDSTDLSSLASLANVYVSTDRDSLYRKSVERYVKSEGLDSQQRAETLANFSMFYSSKDSLYVKALFEDLMQLPFDQASITEVYARYLLYKGTEPEEIPHLFERVLQYEPDNRWAIIQLLFLAVDKNDSENVIRLSDDAIMYFPETLLLYFYKARAAYLLGSKTEAAEVLELGLSRRSDEDETDILTASYSFLGDLYHDFGDMDKCMAAYDSALVYNPDNISVLNNYAYFLALDGRELERALEMSSKTIEQEPDDPTYIDTYAWVLFCLERYEEAKPYAEKLLQNTGAISNVEYHHCGDIFAKCGDIKRAVECWQKALDAGDESKILKKKIKKRKYYPNAKRKRK